LFSRGHVLVACEAIRDELYVANRMGMK